MSHLIIKGIDSVYTPAGEFAKTWHGLETVLPILKATGEGLEKLFCPVIECGLKPDFDGEVCQVPEDLKEEGAIDLSDYKLILADCRNGLSGKIHPLHVPKAGYKIHPNREVFDCAIQAAKEVLGQDGFTLVTAGTLGGYSQFFLSILVKGQESFEVGSGDKWYRFFNGNTSHNGLIADTYGLSTIRQVCWNTVNAAQAESEQQGTLLKGKHTPHSTLTAKKLAVHLDQWLKQGEQFRALLLATKAQPLNVEQFKAFAAGVFTNEKSDQLSTNSYNRIEELAPLFVRGRGNVGETRYDAINAFTEYFTSGNGVGSKNVNLSKRIASANFGRGNEWKLEAIRVATNEEVFAATVKRGEILYGDKLKTLAATN